MTEQALAQGQGKRQRLEYVDVARGFAMLCILLGHLGSPTINRVVFTFRLPIFYLIAGYFTPTRGSVRSFVAKRFRTLIVPYLVVAALVIVGRTVRTLLSAGLAEASAEFVTWLTGALYGAGGNIATVFPPFPTNQIGALWFLLAMFWGSVLFRWLVDRTPVVRLVAVLAVFSLSVYLSYLQVWLPWSIQAGGCGLLWIYVGWLWRRMGEGAKPQDDEARMAAVVLCVAVWACFVRDFESFYLVNCMIGHGPTDIAASLCACYVVVRACDWATKRHLPLTGQLTWFVRLSLLALCVHELDMYVFPWHTVNSWLQGTGRSSVAILAVRAVIRVVMVVAVTWALSKSKTVLRIMGMDSKVANPKPADKPN